MDLHPDFRDLLAAFADEKVRYLLIGGYAVAFHGHPRFTKDIDLWIAGDETNLERVQRALDRFGAPPTVLRSLEQMGPRDIVYMGAPPARVDLLRHVDGADFESAWNERVRGDWDGVELYVISLDHLIATKRAAGRDRDLADAKILERRSTRRSP